MKILWLCHNQLTMKDVEIERIAIAAHYGKPIITYDNGDFNYITLAKYDTLEEANDEFEQLWINVIENKKDYYRFRNTLLENRIMNKLTEE